MAIHRISVALNLGEGKPLPSNFLGLLREDLLGTGVHVLVASVDSFDKGVLKGYAEVATEVSDDTTKVQKFVQGAFDKSYGAISDETSDEDDADEVERKAKLDQFLKDHPLYEDQIKEARVSGSPFHLVAAKIAAQEAAKAAETSSSTETPSETIEPAVGQAEAGADTTTVETFNLDSADTDTPKTGK